jgi:hypothetical protein
MALTAPVTYNHRGGNLVGTNSYIVRNNETIFAGALVGLDPNSGALCNWSSASSGANIRFKGIACPVAAPNIPGQTTVGAVIGNTSANPVPECPVDESGVILEGIAVTGALPVTPGQTTGHPGVPVFATDNNTFTVSTTSNVGAVGELIRCTAAAIGDVRLFTPQEYLALEAIGKV